MGVGVWVVVADSMLGPEANGGWNQILAWDEVGNGAKPEVKRGEMEGGEGGIIVSMGRI